MGFAAVYKYEDLAYLFFLAIDEACRSRGYGSVAIKTLKEIYPDKTHVVDFEKPDDSANNCIQRKKRRDFYIRNGYKETGCFLSYLGVDYEIFCMNEIFDIYKFKAMMKTLRIEGFNPIYFQKKEIGGDL